MLGIRYTKSQPTVHFMPFRKGRVVRQGVGQLFLCCAPATVVVGKEKQNQIEDARTPDAAPSSSTGHLAFVAGMEPRMGVCVQLGWWVQQ